VRLEDLHRGFRGELGRLTAEFEYLCPKRQATCGAMEPAVQAHSVLRLHDAWARFSRSLVLFSAGSHAYTASSMRLPRAPHVSALSDVIPRLRSLYPKKPPWWEPRWGDITECLAAAKALAIVNYATVAAALSATPSPVDDVRILRNYFAHRSEETSRKAIDVGRKLGAAGKIRPVDVAVLIVGPSETVFNQWVSQFLGIAEAAIQ
jgi:hypothetical protein